MNSFFWISRARLSAAALIAVLPLADAARGQAYNFELVNNGAVVANTNNSSSDNTAFPSVIKVPDWVDVSDRPDPAANYYLYYGNHSGQAIKMKWASAIDGIWADYDFTGGTGPNPSQGVFDVGALTNDPTRDDYDHISAPDIVIDDANQQFIMYFHGERLAGDGVPKVHERFVATSGTGLNFNDPVSGNGESGHGPVEVTSGGVTRDVWIGDDYMKTFELDGRFYGVGKRGIINAAPATGDIWAPSPGDPFGEAWDREDTPEANWAALTNDPSGDEQDDYHSPGATFLASQEFADHPNNPNSRRIFSNGNDERMNHVDVNLLKNDLLEVFFYVREASSSDPDDYNAVYRLLYDVSAPDFQDWTVARDAFGQVIFDVVLTPEDVSAAVVDALGTNYDAELFADPVSLGDTEIFIDDDGAKYLFFSYVSDEYGGQQGEGQITSVRLLANPDLTGDGEVDQDDLDLVLLNFGARGLTGDANIDGVTDYDDLTYTLQNWTSTTAPILAVPEPGTAAVLGLLSVLGLSRRRRNTVQG